MSLSKNFDLDILDFSDLDREEILQVREAIGKQEDFYGYIPGKGTNFIIKNYQKLAEIGCLESSWITAYINRSCSWDKNLPFKTMKVIFDACNRDTLSSLYPVTEDHVPVLERGKYHCISLFRGCASHTYSPGMSWTTNLSKAIWYAANSRAGNDDIPNTHECSVYTSIVTKEDIYCFLAEKEPEYIVVPEKYWKVDVPQEEFRQDRHRW